MSATEWDDEKPWERQPFDTEVSWPLFQRYLLSWPRDLQSLIKGARPPYTWGQLQDVAWSCGWALRAQAYDLHRYAQIRGIKEQAEVDDARASFRIRTRMQTIVETELERLSKLQDENEKRGDSMGVLMTREIARMAEASFKMDRLLRGQTTENVQPSTDLSHLSVEDLRELRRLQKKACA